MIIELTLTGIAIVATVAGAPRRVYNRYKFHRRKRWFMKHWQFSERYAKAWAAKYDW